MFSERESGRTRLYVKKWEVFLRWIDSQYAAIATECGYVFDDSAHDTPSRRRLSKGTGGFKSWKSHAASRKGRRTQNFSLLDPKPSKISKSASKKSDHRRRRQQSSSGEANLTTMSERTVEEPVPIRRSKRTRRSRISGSSNGLEMTNLRPLHPSKITKSKATAHQTKRVTHANCSEGTKHSMTDLGLRLVAHSKASPKNRSTSNGSNSLRRSPRKMAQI